MAEHPSPIVVEKRERDLWAEAVALLEDEDKKQIEVGILNERAVAESVLNTVKAQQQKCVAKEYSFKFNGKKINVRQFLGNVLKWVEKFKRIIDFAVSLDKSGHTALPWACINLVLEVSYIYLPIR